MIKAIVFDWHGVLDDVTFRGLVRKLAEFKRITPDEVRIRLEIYDSKYALGEISPKEYWSTVKGKIGLTSEELEAAKDYLLQVNRNDSLWSKIPELKQIYRLAILSDCALDKVEVIRRKVNLSYFEEAYFSAEKKKNKDSNEFFMDLLAVMRLTPQDCLYVDDSEKNIERASSLGFKTCLFKKTEDLEICLAAV